VMITFTDNDSVLTIVLGDPDPDACGRIVAIDLGVLDWLDRRARVLDRLRRRGGSDGSQAGPKEASSRL
jgi:hypothetical protein